MAVRPLVGRRPPHLNMADSERSTPISYMRSIVTFFVSRTVSELLEVLFQREICIVGPNFWGF